MLLFTRTQWYRPCVAIAIVVALFTFVISDAGASHFSDVIRGKILLDVEASGEAWYVYPPTMERYYLGRPIDAFDIMRELGLGITDADLEKIPDATASSDPGTHTTFRQGLAGRILIQTEQNGEAWYVNPDDLQRYYLGRPADAFRVMSNFGLGITSSDLAHVPIANSSLEPPLDTTHIYRTIDVQTERGTFPVALVTLRRDAFAMVTDTAEDHHCESDCAAKPLAEYVHENNAFAGIHGTYFCPPDYAPCEGAVNTFLPPVFNSVLDTMINEGGLPFHDRPFIAESASGQLFYFQHASMFGDSVSAFEHEFGVDLAAAIGNWPSMVENGNVVVRFDDLEEGFKTAGLRGGIGWNEDVVFFGLVSNASVLDSAHVFQAIGADYAMNLDGGGSSALYYDGSYRRGPGRDLPNAILFRRR